MDLYLQVDVTGEGVVALRGELDAGSTHVLQGAVATLSRSTGAIVLDGADLAFIDVAGVRVLAELAACEPMVQFVVRSPQPSVARVCALLRELLPGNVTIGSTRPSAPHRAGIDGPPPRPS